MLRPERPMLPQQLVHHKSHAGHIAGILQQGKEEEQGHDDGQEAQHTAHTGKDAVDHQRMHCIVDIPRRQGIVHKDRQVLNAQFQQALQPRADHAEGQIEHQRHNAHERRNRRVLSGEEAVDPCAAQLLLALVGLYHGLIHQLMDKVEPHICNGGGAVQAALLLPSAG